MIFHPKSCESYAFVVAVLGSKQNGGKWGGFGPGSDPYTKETKYSVGAPPKNLQASLLAENKILLKWDASCPTVDDGVGYQVYITLRFFFLCNSLPSVACFASIGRVCFY